MNRFFQIIALMAFLGCSGCGGGAVNKSTVPDSTSTPLSPEQEAQERALSAPQKE